MSTKTTFKRVALVAIAALGLSVVAVAPSSAAVFNETTTLSATTASTVIGTTASVVVTNKFLPTANADKTEATAFLISSPTGNTVRPTVSVTTTALTGQTALNTAGNTVVTGQTTQKATVTATTGGLPATGLYTVSLVNPQIPGTYVVSIVAATASTPIVTWTVTVADTPAITATNSKLYLSDTDLNGNTNGWNAAGEIPAATIAAYAYLINNNNSEAVAQATLAIDYPASSVTVPTIQSDLSTIVASIGVLLRNDTPALNNATAKPITATVTGPGYVKIGGGSFVGKSVTESVATALVDGYVFTEKSVAIISDGTTGTATITISAGGVTLGSKKVVFVGSTASVKEDAETSPSKSIIGVDSTGTLTFNGYDALANLSEISPAAFDFATTSDATVATATALNGVVTVIGKKPGTATITVTNSATAPTISASTTVTIAKTTVAGVKVELDKTDYIPGEKVTLTVSATDADAKPIADGSYTLFSTVLSANVSLLGTTGVAFVAPTGPIELVGGKKTYTFYAPLVSGNLVLTGKDSLTAKNTVTVTGTVTNPAAEIAQAAADAAAEATDAANAATDAANAAAEAADAATAAAQDAADAVAALSVQVTEQIDGLKAQITTLLTRLTALTNLIIKIQKKVKA